MVVSSEVIMTVLFIDWENNHLDSHATALPRQTFRESVRIAAALLTLYVSHLYPLNYCMDDIRFILSSSFVPWSLV